MKRNIKFENQIINNIMDEVKRMYVLEKLNNIGHGYTNFITNYFDRIKQGGYHFMGEDGIMGEFNKYVWKFGYSSEDERKISAIVNKLVKAYYKIVGSFIDQIQTEINDLNITTLKGVMEYGKMKLEQLEK